MGKLCSEINQRMRSQSGASLLIALMFVLIAGMIAAVVISSAAVNAERVNPQRENEQAYLAVESALRSADGLVARDIDGLKVTIATNGMPSRDPASIDNVGLAQWVADDLSRLAQNEDPIDKHIVVKAQDLGGVDVDEVPDVLLTFAVRENGVYVRACQYVDAWKTEGVPSSEAKLRSDLISSAEYAHYLTKQVASISGFKQELPCTVSLNAVKNAEADTA